MCVVVGSPPHPHGPARGLRDLGRPQHRRLYLGLHRRPPLRTRGPVSGDVTHWISFAGDSHEEMPRCCAQRQTRAAMKRGKSTHSSDWVNTPWINNRAGSTHSSQMTATSGGSSNLRSLKKRREPQPRHFYRPCTWFEFK